MKLDPTCNECIRLWREYFEANTHYLRIKAMRQLALLRHDYPEAENLLADVDCADQLRNASRAAMTEHEGTHSTAVAL
jgi:hypothetical protein